MTRSLLHYDCSGLVWIVWWLFQTYDLQSR